MSMTIDVSLVDDHAVVREGYRRLLERTDDIRVVAEAATGGGAYSAFVRESPRVVVMDIALPDVGGIEAMRRILQRDPRAHVLVFSIHDEAVFAERALHAGAHGYLTKASAPEPLVRAVRAVAARRDLPQSGHRARARIARRVRARRRGVAHAVRSRVRNRTSSRARAVHSRHCRAALSQHARPCRTTNR